MPVLGWLAGTFGALIKNLFLFVFQLFLIVVAVIVGTVAFPIVGPASAVLGPVAAALVNVAGRYVWPSPKARADRRAVADLRRQIDAFGRPARIIVERRPFAARFSPPSNTIKKCAVKRA